MRFRFLSLRLDFLHKKDCTIVATVRISSLRYFTRFISSSFSSGVQSACNLCPHEVLTSPRLSLIMFFNPEKHFSFCLTISFFTAVIGQNEKSKRAGRTKSFFIGILFVDGCGFCGNGLTLGKSLIISGEGVKTIDCIVQCVVAPFVDY